MIQNFADRIKAAAYRFKLRAKLAEAPHHTQHRITNPWHAVSIVPTFGNASCRAVTGLIGQRFLSSEAPRLPLPDCTMKGKCTCRFRHHADRRSDRRRSRDAGMSDGNFYGMERRSRARGRRSTDV